MDRNKVVNEPDCEPSVDEKMEEVPTVLATETVTTSIVTTSPLVNHKGGWEPSLSPVLSPLLSPFMNNGNAACGGRFNYSPFASPANTLTVAAKLELTCDGENIDSDGKGNNNSVMDSRTACDSVEDSMAVEMTVQSEASKKINEDENPASEKRGAAMSHTRNISDIISLSRPCLISAAVTAYRWNSFSKVCEYEVTINRANSESSYQVYRQYEEFRPLLKFCDRVTKSLMPSPSFCWCSAPKDDESLEVRRGKLHSFMQSFTSSVPYNSEDDDLRAFFYDSVNHIAPY
jgi:hypothetical protein